MNHHCLYHSIILHLQPTCNTHQPDRNIIHHGVILRPPCISHYHVRNASRLQPLPDLSRRSSGVQGAPATSVQVRGEERRATSSECYATGPDYQISTLQQAIFPPYFGFQTALPIVLALTWPGDRLIAADDAVARQHAGYSGLLEQHNRWIALVPILTMFATSLANLLVLGPATTKVMKLRKHQGENIHVSCSMQTFS